VENAQPQRVELLQRALAVHEAVLSHVNQGISCFDAELKLQICNQRYLDLLNFPKELGRPGTPFEAFIRYNAERGEYGPGDVEEQVRVRVDAARKRQPHRFERTRPDGTTLEIIGNPLDDGGFVTTYADVTERTRQAQHLAEAQHRVELALEGADLGLWDWDLSAGTISFNERFPEMLGLDPSAPITIEAIGRLIHPDELSKCRLATVEVLRGLTPGFDAELRCLHVDGHWVWVLMRGKVVDRDANGRALRMIGTSLDISARKRDEALLLERERRLATLVRSLQDLIFVLDTTGTLLEFWSIPGLDLGLQQSEALGREFRHIMPPALVEPIEAGMVELFMDAGTLRFEFALEREGKRQLLQATMSRLADTGKYATGYLVVVRDISELERLRRSVAEAE
jgi:PAS domain S-box-containing protein